MDDSRRGTTRQHLHLLSAAPLTAQAPTTLLVQLLGGFTFALGEHSLDGSAWRLHKAQTLIKLLLLAPGHRLHRERALELLWPDLDVEAAANNLHYAMHAARGSLAQLWAPAPAAVPSPPDSPSGPLPGHAPGTLLRIRHKLLTLDLPVPLWIDAEAFEAAAADARRSTDAHLYEAAIALYRGDLLPDDPFEEWAANRRTALRASYLALLLDLAHLYASHGVHAHAIATFERVLTVEPAHEDAHTSLMWLYAQTGQRHQALRQYERLQDALRRELDTTPGPASRRLYDDILAGRPLPALSSSSSPEPPRPQPHDVPSTSALPELQPAAPNPTRLRPPQADESSPTQTPAFSLVGRRDALAQVRAAWTAAATRPQALLIEGESGIGKSRVAEAALAWAARHDHHGQPIATAIARCYLAEGDLPFAPVVTWLRSAALWPGVLALEAVWQSEVARLVPELLVECPDLPQPAPLPERWQRPRLFEALARAVTASGRPLLFVLDDLHWCEQETLEWLRYLLRRPAAAPLLVVGTARVEEITPDHPLVALTTDLRRAGQLTAIALGPLDGAEVATLGAQVAGQALDAEQAEQLYAETEGNPLFVLELVRAGLLDRPVHQPSKGSDGSAAVEVRALPLTMQAVISARLRQLSLSARELASLAAVVGREFSAELLAQAGGHADSAGPSERDEEALEQALEELQQRRIVREQGPGAYDFSHDKLREVAYAALSATRRRALHRRVAQALEAVSADALDAVSAQLAAHYEQGGEPLKASRALERAGRLAIRQGALTRAREYLQRAIALARASEQMRCYEELGDGYWLFGAFGPYLEALARWRRLETGAQDPLVGARLLRKLLYVWLRSVPTHPLTADELAAMAADARRLAERAGDEDELARVRIAALCIAWRCGSPTAEDVLRGQAEILAAADHLAARGDWEAYSAALDADASCFFEIGAFAEFVEIHERRLSAPDLSPVERGDAVGGLAYGYFVVGDYERCMAMVRAYVAQTPPDAPLLLWEGNWAAAWAAWLTGRWDELGVFVDVSQRLVEESGQLLLKPLRSYWALLHVALAREDQAAVATATAMLEPSLAPGQRDADWAPLLAAYGSDDLEPLLARPPGALFSPTMLAWFVLMFLNERGVAVPQTILDSADTHPQWWHRHICKQCVQMAEAVAAGDPGRLAAAIEQAEAGGLIPHAARMRIVLAQRTSETTHLERARPVLEQLGDRQFLRRLERVAAELA
jgi:DNA-binding SARP family transcriptional activator